MTRLSRSSLARLDPSVLPRAEPRASGVVHLGVGAFHRAHQAVYTEDAMAATGDDRWGISGFTQRGIAVVDALAPQDGLYSVRAADELRVVGSVREVLPPGEDLPVRLAAPETKIVTLTVTEKGYLRAPSTGGLLVDSPEIVADLAGSGAEPYTVVGRLVRGLRARAAEDAGPVTVVCCDNLPGNGAALARLVREFASRLPDHGPLLEWIGQNVRFPSTVVDRIVPATTAEDLAEARRRLGVEDRGAVVTEPFTQWVIEDCFAGERPAWERAGALLVDDVTPYERMKLRLLNGSHSAIAYLAETAYVSDAVANPELFELIRRLMDELTLTLSGLDGFDLAAYQASLLSRFANPALKHRVAQIATDGAQKLPQRLLDPARDLLAMGREPRWTALAVAAWMHHETALPAALGRQDVERTVDRLLAIKEIFGADLPEDLIFRGLVTAYLGRLTADGPAKTIRALLR